MTKGTSRRKPPRRARSSLAAARIALITASVGLVAFLAVCELLSGGAGGHLAGRLFGTRDLSRTACRIDRAVDATLVKLTISDMESEREERASGRYVWPYWRKSGRIPHGVSTVECNLAMTKAVSGAGGRIVRATERGPDWRGLTTLDMRMGFREIETHRVGLKESPASEDDEPGASAAARSSGAPERAAPRVAIIIDDFGHNNSKVATGFAEVDFPITMSVLPHCLSTTAIAAQAHQAGKEILAHLPMEPEGYPEVDPGPGALLASHSLGEIKGLVEKALNDVPFAVGVNNHMGSALTKDSARMRAVMQSLKGTGLFFVDSMTTPMSVAYKEARRAGVPSARNLMYLDSDIDQRGTVDVEAQLAELEELAWRRGEAIGIGHPRKETLRMLRKKLPEMVERGIELVFVSELAR